MLLNPDLPFELLCLILGHLTSYVSVLNLSRTCRTFRGLFKNDPVCSTQFQTLFKAFEHSENFVLSQGVRKVRSKDKKRKRSIVGLSRVKNPKTPSPRPQNILLVEGYLPCYFCYKFKPKQNFHRRQRSGRYALRRNTQNPIQDRFCLDCVIDGRAIDRFNQLELLQDRWQPWKIDTFVQIMPKYCNGWRLGDCKRCGRASWTRALSELKQLLLELCDVCYHSKTHHIDNFATATKLGIADHILDKIFILRESPRIFEQQIWTEPYWTYDPLSLPYDIPDRSHEWRTPPPKAIAELDPPILNTIFLHLQPAVRTVFLKVLQEMEGC